MVVENCFLVMGKSENIRKNYNDFATYFGIVHVNIVNFFFLGRPSLYRRHEDISAIIGADLLF